ncbi:MAG TPA: hypothetical protein VNO33_24660 [Kofleriaceae bacterium]|nr:hypothetical protein [Kofleriaceae bacterium]
MRRRARLIAGAIALLAGGPASGHVAPSERENNRYVLLAPLGDRLRLVYTVYMGQVPGRRARQRMDRDGDGRISDAEADEYGRQTAAQAAPRLSLEVDGRQVPIVWQEVDVGLGQPVTDAGAFAVDMVVWVCFERPRERLEHRVRFHDRFHLPDPGETELRAEESPGVRITRSQLGDAGKSGAVRLDFRWMGGPGPAETDGYTLELAVDPALATFTGESCGEPAEQSQLAPRLIALTGALLAIGIALWVIRRRSKVKGRK